MKNMDSETNLLDLKNMVKNFCDDRDWEKYHGAKELSIGIIMEASELLEHFRFKSDIEIEEILENITKRDAIGEELSDIFFLILRFAQKYNFNLSSELIRKIEINKSKYPINKAKGSNKKYTEL